MIKKILSLFLKILLLPFKFLKKLFAKKPKLISFNQFKEEIEELQKMPKCNFKASYSAENVKYEISNEKEKKEAASAQKKANKKEEEKKEE